MQGPSKTDIVLALIADVRDERDTIGSRIDNLRKIAATAEMVVRSLLNECRNAVDDAVTADPLWLSIDTAPKGSKAIMVFCPERKNTYIVTWTDEGWRHFGTDALLREDPTRWRWVPAPGESAQ